MYARLFKITVTFGTAWIVWTIYYINFDTKSLDFVYRNLIANANRTINFTIFNQIPWYDHHTIDSFNKCEYKNCMVILRADLLYKVDAVIFDHSVIKWIPPRKNRNQKWIFFSMESPYFTLKRYTLYNFDWIMSYHRNADILSPYGFIRKRYSIPFINYTNIFRKKTTDVAWIVSHCDVPSKRDEYVRELRKYIKVDIYGKCGNYSCSKERVVECKKTLSKTYKFYLSFENSLCIDYLTEKIYTFYENDVNVVPVVRGAPNVRDHLPFGTYILTSDFKSPKDLAKHLNFVGNNETIYSSFLRQKDTYYTTYTKSNDESGMCKICKMLNRGTMSKAPLNIKTWLWDGQCIEPSDI